MRVALLLLIIGAVNCETTDCSKDVSDDFRQSLYQFSFKLFKVASNYCNYHFALSQYSTWMQLAAIAESVTGEIQRELFDVLQLPEDPCLRQKYYEIAVQLDPSYPILDFNFMTRRLLAVDESIILNETWANEIHNIGLLTPISLPLRKNFEGAVTQLPYYFFRDVGNLPINSRSFLLESLEYHLPWKTGFLESRIQRNVPFYGASGRETVRVNMLRTKRPFRMAYEPHFKAKFLEIPVGKEDRYSMIFILNENLNQMKQALNNLNVTQVLNAFKLIKKPMEPVDVAIPKFTMETNYNNMKLLLEQIGVKNLWSDPLDDKPTALPSEYIQNILVDIDARGFEVDNKDYELPTDVNKGVSFAEDTKTFIANQPFMFALVDKTYKVILFGGIYSGVR